MPFELAITHTVFVSKNVSKLSKSPKPSFIFMYIQNQASTTYILPNFGFSCTYKAERPELPELPVHLHSLNGPQSFLITYIHDLSVNHLQTFIFMRTRFAVAVVPGHAAYVCIIHFSGAGWGGERNPSLGTLVLSN